MNPRPAPYSTKKISCLVNNESNYSLVHRNTINMITIMENFSNVHIVVFSLRPSVLSGC